MIDSGQSGFGAGIDVGFLMSIIISPDDVKYTSGVNGQTRTMTPDIRS